MYIYRERSTNLLHELDGHAHLLCVEKDLVRAHGLQLADLRVNVTRVAHRLGGQGGRG